MRLAAIVVFALLVIACGEPSNSVAAESTPGDVAQPGNWQVDPETSSVKFRATQNGNSFEGGFGAFSAEIGLDPENLEGAFIRAEIDISTIDAGSDDRNGALPTREWFHVKDFPIATFESDEISATGEGTFVAKGNLTIKGIAKEVSLPFSLAIDGGKAEATADLELLRTDYTLGPKEDWVGEAVEVSIEIFATRTD